VHARVHAERGHISDTLLPPTPHPPLQVVKPLLGKYAALVQFVKAAEVRRYFTPETLPEEFREEPFPK
jgi:hypothetical protein